jgi:hypothetical protein
MAGTQLSDLLKFSLIRFGFESHLERRRVRKRAAEMMQVGIVFIHVPRAAGSSIAHLLYGRFIGHFPVTALQAQRERELLALPRLAVTRNPWDRLASAYRFAIAGGGQGPLAARVAPHVGQVVAKTGSFERFVKEWLRDKDIGSIDGLFRPQTYYLCDEAGELSFDHLGRIEDMQETELWLSNWLGREVHVPRANAAPDHVALTRYDSEMIDIVANAYASDIERLGY